MYLSVNTISRRKFLFIYTFAVVVLISIFLGTNKLDVYYKSISKSDGLVLTQIDSEGKNNTDCSYRVTQFSSEYIKNHIFFKKIDLEVLK